MLPRLKIALFKFLRPIAIISSQEEDKPLPHSILAEDTPHSSEDLKTSTSTAAAQSTSSRAGKNIFQWFTLQKYQVTIRHQKKSSMTKTGSILDEKIN